MDHQLNNFRERDVGTYVVAQASDGSAPTEMPSAANLTPFILALTVFVVVLKGYQR